MGLRAEIEADLVDTLEGDFGLPVELISPDGVRYTTSANDPTQTLVGQILYDSVSQDADGNTMIDARPVVTLRRSSLARIPLDGERWSVRIPVDPTAGATIGTFLLERAPEGGRSIGFIRLYLRAAEQSS